MDLSRFKFVYAIRITHHSIRNNWLCFFTGKTPENYCFYRNLFISKNLYHFGPDPNWVRFQFFLQSPLVSDFELRISSFRPLVPAKAIAGAGKAGELALFFQKRSICREFSTFVEFPVYKFFSRGHCPRFVITITPSQVRGLNVEIMVCFL